MATYRAFSSSRVRAALSVASRSCALGGAAFSLTKNTIWRGAAASPGQSISTAGPLGGVGALWVSSSSTVSASKPLAPCTVSNCTACGLTGRGTGRVWLRSARTHW